MIRAKGNEIDMPEETPHERQPGAEGEDASRVSVRDEWRVGES
jgi:hypothetical protein